MTITVIPSRTVKWFYTLDHHEMICPNTDDYMTIIVLMRMYLYPYAMTINDLV